MKLQIHETNQDSKKLFKNCLENPTTLKDMNEKCLRGDLRGFLHDHKLRLAKHVWLLVHKPRNLSNKFIYN